MELTLLTNYNTDLSGFHWLDTTEFESTKGPVYSIQDNLQTKQKLFISFATHLLKFVK